jgi:ATP-dependent exoDNAse (exonuclease V) beta subunit
VKSVKEEESEHMLWGNQVHKAFENRIKNGDPLPEDLNQHESFLKSLEAKGGSISTERKIALNTKARPCGFFDKDVWFRGVIDLSIIDGTTALLVDYKTGKPHSKFKQLKLFALHTMAEYPEVENVEVKFYWTKTETSTGEVYSREQIQEIWSEFAPDLKQYAQAFKTDTWQPRQSGLCHGWCPVTSCEFWKPKRKK